jgi:hypothetical protein
MTTYTSRYDCGHTGEITLPEMTEPDVVVNVSENCFKCGIAQNNPSPTMRHRIHVTCNGCRDSRSFKGLDDLVAGGWELIKPRGSLCPRCSRAARIEREHKAMRMTLLFYAAPETYRRDQHDPDKPVPIALDDGLQAQRMLEKIKETP